jgi:regulator of protease activity HflC (stomatin/prohibitin superfamily)
MEVIIFKVSAGERGVLLTFGKPSDTVLSEGLHFKIPFVQKIVKRMHAYTTDKTPAAVGGPLGTISGIYCILTAFTKRSKS